HCCSRLDKEYYSTDLTSDILSAGKSSRLYTKLVKDKKMFSSIHAYQTGNIDKGLFVVEGKLLNGIKPENAEKAVWEELDSIKTNGVSEVELEKVGNNIESILTFDEMAIGDKALNLAFFEMLGDANLYNKQLEIYQACTASEIKDTANTIFKESNCNTLYYNSEHA
ncbi:MAG: insulinase family protein, partial [Bacteroidia bacterium]|nr:insulinase family protein [Bacteroidia bacterium]